MNATPICLSMGAGMDRTVNGETNHVEIRLAWRLQGIKVTKV